MLDASAAAASCILFVSSVQLLPVFGAALHCSCKTSEDCNVTGVCSAGVLNMNAEINVYPVVEYGITGQEHFSNSSFLANVACRSKDVAVRSFILEYPKLWQFLTDEERLKGLYTIIHILY